MSESDVYKSVKRGGLKFKGDPESKKSKKKRKHKNLDNQLTVAVPEEFANAGAADHRTKAEKAFAKIKRKRLSEEALKKAQKSHKERIMEFNEKLDSLSEHYDIPKVSWTK